MENTIKKERIFAFDFIRMLATMSIILIHYNAVYLYMNPQRYDLTLITNNVANIYLGSWGVSLFFILSGASLMYVYQDNMKLKLFYKKRFLSIYPMFWIAYFIVLLIHFYLYKGFTFVSAPISNFVFTIIGLDGNLMTVIPTFYILGEWFLGCIIMMYIVFPLLRKMIINIPILTVLIVSLIFIFMEYVYNLPLARDVIFLTRLPELCFGMYFVKYIKNTNFIMALIAGVTLICNWIIKPQIPLDIQVLYVGIASFVLLMYIADFFKNIHFIKDFCNYISKYSYAIFLTHHVIIAYITSTFMLETLSKKGSLIVFLICFFITLIVSKGLFVLEKKVTNKIKEYYFSMISTKLIKKQKI